MKLTTSSYNNLHRTLTAYFENDGMEPDEVAEAVAEEMENVETNQFSFALWDALGCDDEGLVENDPNLQKLYKEISKAWQKSLKSVKQ